MMGCGPEGVDVYEAHGKVLTSFRGKDRKMLDYWT